MKQWVALLVAAACVLSLPGCRGKEVPPTIDGSMSYDECWSGTITDLFTEGGGADLAEVIALTIRDHDTMYFTITEDTEYFRYYSDTGEAEDMDRGDLSLGAWVEIECESYDDSGYHPIHSVKVIESTDLKVTLKEPPALTVVWGETGVNALRGGYSWTIEHADGTAEAVIADSMSALQSREYMEVLTLNAAETSPAALLRFETAPDAVRVRCWGVDAWGGHDGEPEGEDAAVNTVEADFAEGRFTTEYWVELKDGSYIYEVTAEWDRPGKYSGTAYYGFCAVKPDTELRPTEE